MAGSPNPIDRMIQQVIREKVPEKIPESTRAEDKPLVALGLTVLDIYELIVALEDRYQITIGDGDGPVHSWTPSSLSHCIKKKLIQKPLRTAGWKDTFENLVFSGKLPALRTPLTIHLDPTFRCNSRCIFCYDSSGDTRGGDEMTLAELRDVIDQCKAMDVVEITFGGGEPFIREDFVDMVKHVKKQNLRFFVLSNGTLITEKAAKDLARIMDPRFDHVQVSLDGPCPEIHDRQRGVDGTFAKAMRGIGNLQRAGITPVVNTVLTRINYTHIPEMIPFLIDRGIQVFRVLRLHPLGRCHDLRLYEQLRLNPEETESIFEFLFQKREELIGQLHLSNDNACIFPMSAKALRRRVPPQPGKPPASYACGAGTTKLSISPDGSIFPCSYMYEFPELRIGSVRQKTLQELWGREELWNVYRKPIHPVGKCEICEYLYHCKTGCRILSYAVHGDMGAPDPGCSYEPTGIADFGLRIAD
jgi:radical SAM protein with 4Fe4S-binding SPASM domain